MWSDYSQTVNRIRITKNLISYVRSILNTKKDFNWLICHKANEINTKCTLSCN